jgi:hypothetical protein
MMSRPLQFEDGVTVEWANREAVRYSKNGYSAIVWCDFESGFFSRGRVIMLASIEFWESHPPNTSPKITHVERERIVSYVQRYFDMQRIPIRKSEEPIEPENQNELKELKKN